MLRVAVDAMGGDHAPEAIVEGAVDYARAHPERSLLLVGVPHSIEPCLDRLGKVPDNIHIHEAPEVIGMADKIAALKEKPNDSMNTCARLVHKGEADAMVLCGNTGCSVAAAQLHLKRIRGVRRAGILTPLPAVHGQTWVIDCGANAVGKPEHLAQWAELGSVFLASYLRREAPRVGVLSIGSEDGKGHGLTAETLALLREHPGLNLVGNVEGNDIFNGAVDLVVCDGFTGNVVLKAAEGVAQAITDILKEGVRDSLRCKLGALLMKPAFEHLKRRTSWRHVGGALLLGVDGVTIIGHGRSRADAVAAAIGQAVRCVETQAVTHLHDYLDAQEAEREQRGEQPTRRASIYASVMSFFGKKPPPKQGQTDSDDDLPPQPSAE